MFCCEFAHDLPALVIILHELCPVVHAKLDLCLIEVSCTTRLHTTHTTAWYRALSTDYRVLKDTAKGTCYSSRSLLYGNGCARLLPPEKWFGYPGCRAKFILPAFGSYMRQKFKGQDASHLVVVDEHENALNDRMLRVSFAVRDVGSLTGRR